jgi:hypothetical protein
MWRGATVFAALLAIAVATAPAASALPPGAPTAVVVKPGPTPGPTGPLTVSFKPGPNNGKAITSYTASCTSPTQGVAGQASRAASPIVVPNLTAGNPYFCTVAATNADGVGPASVAGRAIVGTPGPPHILRALPLANGLAIPYTAAANNGRPILNYRGICQSSDGGVPSSPLQVVSPMVATNLTPGKTYTCVVTAQNSRGAGTPVTVGPLVIQAPNLPSMATCVLDSGSMTATPGLLLTDARPQTLALAATLKSCTGPYVSSGRISFSMRTPSEARCQSLVNMQNGGNGKITWTAPLGMGTAGASLRIIITSTSGHVTQASFFGIVTSRSNFLTGRHISGNVTLQRGLNPLASGGDCNLETPIANFPVSALRFTVR